LTDITSYCDAVQGYDLPFAEQKWIQLQEQLSISRWDDLFHSHEQVQQGQTRVTAREKVRTLPCSSQRDSVTAALSSSYSISAFSSTSTRRTNTITSTLKPHDSVHLWQFISRPLYRRNTRHQTHNISRYIHVLIHWSGIDQAFFSALATRAFIAQSTLFCLPNASARPSASWSRAHSQITHHRCLLNHH
jgi:hypothetical protein